VTEIQNGHGSRPFFNDIVTIARGDPSIDIRATVGDTCQDANEQVKCLINLATDPRVLGVMWAGWQPFL
jgi:DNA-dependent protein kinase catalytic subunit